MFYNVCLDISCAQQHGGMVGWPAGMFYNCVCVLKYFVVKNNVCLDISCAQHGGWYGWLASWDVLQVCLCVAGSSAWQCGNVWYSVEMFVAQCGNVCGSVVMFVTV